jgi:AcrR family transcriptional regulator
MKTTQRQIQKENTRKKILETALVVFSAKGILNTRMSDIAEAAGVSHGTVFAHFSSQEELITAVIEKFGLEVGWHTHELASRSASVRDVLSAHLEGIQQFEPFYTRLIIESHLLPAVARDTLIAIQSSISFHLSQAAEREIKAGTILPIPIHLLFNTWIGLVHYYLTNHDLFAPDGSVIQRYGPALLEHYLQLISPRNK